SIRSIVSKPRMSPVGLYTGRKDGSGSARRLVATVHPPTGHPWPRPHLRRSRGRQANRRSPSSWSTETKSTRSSAWPPSPGAPARDRGGAYPRGREPTSPRGDGTDASASPHGTEYRRGATVPEPEPPPDDPPAGPRPGLEHGQGTPGHVRDGRRIPDPGHRAK